MYTLALHMPERRLEVKYTGLLTAAEIIVLRDDIVATLDRHRLGPGLFVTLVDMTECPIQPQPVHEALSRFTIDPAIRPARMAIWTGEAASRMQARRARQTCPTHLFEHRADALAWLAAADVHGDGTVAAA